MCEFVRTEKGWVVCWGGAALYGAKAETAPRPVIVAAETLPEARPGDDREPTKVLSA